MKRRYLILSLFLTLCLIVISISIYIAKKSLREVSLEGEKLPIPALTYQSLPFATETGKAEMKTQESKSSLEQISKKEISQADELKEIKKAETEPEEELEFNLNEVPDEYFNKDIKVIEDKAKEEGASPVERKLNKQPSLQKLNELKTQGVIIY